MRKYLTIITAVVIMASLLAACSPGSALTGLAQKQPTVLLQQSGTPTAAPSTPVTGSVSANGTLASLQGTLEQIYNQVNPSVVEIQVTSGVASQSNQGQSPFNFGNPGQGGQPFSQALGSGFVWDNQGNIVTNNHVVDGATTVQVTFADGFTVPAKVIGTDLNSDLAVIRVQAGNETLKPVTMADASNLKVGQLAIAIGNPFGLSNTMTMGIISATGRSLPVNSNVTTGSYTIPDIIQTDAPINPGNSGGVLLNDQGQVVGVTSAIDSSTGSNAGIGFAIPSAIVQKVVPALIKNGSYTYSWLGISGTTLTYDLNQAMKLNSDQRGALVAEVTANGPAAKAGLQGSSQQTSINGQNVPVGGDIITAIDGQAVKSFDDLVSYLVLNTQPGQKVTLSVLRSGKQQNIDVTLEARPAQVPSQSATQGTNPFGNLPGQGQNNNNNGQGQTQPAGVYLGIVGANLTSAINKAAGLDANQKGILIEQVQQGSPAEQAGLKAGTKSVTVNGRTLMVGGDVITAIDGNPVTTVNELSAMLQQYNPGQNATLTVLRNGQEGQVTVTLAARPG